MIFKASTELKSKQSGFCKIVKLSLLMLCREMLLLLQEAERDSIQLQEQLNGLQEEKERLLNSLVEAE